MNALYVCLNATHVVLQKPHNGTLINGIST
jgi:hypothetical protein